ncbi:HAD superfamily hydrolase [Syntrophotalea carbinolica DSM 2380]|uniref:phosphoglycolate phosphatase n=1 Tax=Syntrophotalea carbinolica (strain DSM 2380 / NBRC 103641 / GraBd1) TaxID=338963 RepID=Q3A7I3_SYNC1|nr:HAD-IA family hydrolase [Syntrophotalea carbinolica]ABA87661.1 HAD superfamily hydrolase [Syntrophotalea carbinolica DSM 2380]
MSFDTLLFDLDGTLIDSAADLGTAVNLLRAEIDLAPLSIDQVRTYVGDGATMLVRRALPEKAFSEQKLRRFLQLYEEHLVEKTATYPGIDDFLMAQQGKKMAVITNKPFDITMRLLYELGLTAFFGCIIGANGGLPKKPDPAPVFMALRDLQSDAHKAVMIGDHHTDLRAGHAAGIKTCFCAWGIGRTDGFPYDYLAETPQDLSRLFPA